jgi:hypothetical protein
MRRWQEQLKVARAEARIRQRDYNAARRALERVLGEIARLEKRIELKRTDGQPTKL